MKSRGLGFPTLEILVSQLFGELGKIQKGNLDLYSKNPIFHLFHEKKLEVQIEQHSKIPKFLRELGKSWKYIL